MEQQPDANTTENQNQETRSRQKNDQARRITNNREEESYNSTNTTDITIQINKHRTKKAAKFRRQAQADKQAKLIRQQ